MRSLKILICAIAVFALTVSARAEPLKIGSPAPNFSKLECTDGTTCSVDDFKNKEVLVICITCNHCPVAESYEDRIIEFNKKYGGEASKVGFIAINVNNIAPD